MRENKDYFVRNIVNHVKSLTDYLHLWQRQVLGLNTAASTQFSHQPDDLDAKQLTILAHVRESLAVRHSTYEEEQQSHYQVDRPDSDDDPLEEDPVLPQEPMHCVHSMAHDWRKFILLCGKPGTGKTHTVITAIREAIHNDWRVAIAAPTGFLASGYRTQFDHHVLVDTVHSMFQYPVDPVQRPEVNWILSDYVLVIDEISMIPVDIFHHITRTIQDLPLRPVLVLSGDEQQQQPIASDRNRTVQTTSILHHRFFYALVIKYTLTRQFRCDDQVYSDMLNHLRYYRPTWRFLQKLHDGRILITGRVVTDDNIFDTLVKLPSATVLTI